MTFLRYHFLLATIVSLQSCLRRCQHLSEPSPKGNPGVLIYHDTSIGKIISEHRTKAGAAASLAQDVHSGLIAVGQQNGVVSLWSPTSSEPHVRILSHMGPVKSISFDPSSSGRHWATGSLDGTVKTWDARNMANPVTEWRERGEVGKLSFSQKGLLSVSWGPSHVSVRISSAL